MAVEHGFYVSAGTYEDTEKNYKVSHMYLPHQFEIAWKVYEQCADYLWREFEYVDAKGITYSLNVAT